MTSTEWCTIESDPGVFTELIENIGVKGAQVEEIFTLDDAHHLQQLKPIYGLVFLFKWTSEGGVAKQECALPEGLYFPKQTVQNACATQAILSILLNTPDVELGETLTEFKKQTMSLGPNERGVAIGNNETLRKVHNSFARPEPIELEKRAATKDDDVFHFVGYLPFNGRLIELDGLQEGAIDHGDAGDDWVSSAIPILQQRMAKYSTDVISFSLMGIVKNRLESLQEQIQACELQLNDLKAKATSGDSDEKESAEANISIVEEQLTALNVAVADESQKRMHWSAENKRRKHNYIPFLMNFLSVLAEKDKLMPLVEKAKAKRNANNN